MATRIARERVLAIVRSASADTAQAVAEALLDAGARVLEVSLTTPGALAVVERLAQGRPDALIGAGTVLDGASARLALLAGARFLVSPATSEEVIEMGHRYGAAVVAGAQTPTEMTAALGAGADLLKLFPAGSLGPGYLAAVREPLPQAPIVATGGITAETAGGWLRAGAVAVGVGFGGGPTAHPAAAAARLAQVITAVAAAPAGDGGC